MPRSSPQTVRLVSIVRLLAAHPDESFRLSDIARRLQLDKATALPMLSALVDAGWLARRQDTKQYHLGPALVGIGNAAARRFPGSDEVRTALLALAERWGVSFLAFAEDAGYATIVDQVWDVRRSVPPLHVGQRFPIRAPFGAVFAAYGDDGAADRWLAHVPAEQRADYRAALTQLQRDGYGVELRTTTDPGVPAGTLTDERPDAADALLAQLLDSAVTEPAAVNPALHAGVDYDVITVVAPVLRPARTVALALVAVGFPHPLRGELIRELGQDMQLRAARMTRTLRESELAG